jgi:oligopeptide/dipeptide ABC transporter ATP-binding protein
MDNHATEMLSVRDLKTYFSTEKGVVKAVDGISFSLDYGDTLGIVGESGCGKSITARSLMRLVPPPNGKIVSGQVLLDGKDLLKFSKDQMRKIRGLEISMIFQDPMTSLNPVFRVGDQLSEAIRLHQNISKKDSWSESIEMLKKVGIPSPEHRITNYPHQLSGGMRQRVMIAMALSCKPKLLIADEPTTALDVTIQAQIMYLLNELKRETGSSIILITHDMGIIAEMTQKVIVMYAGRIVESAEVKKLFACHYHPYTDGLLRSIPRLDSRKKEKLSVIPGTVPSMLSLPQGCKFSNRCTKSFDKCRESEPDLYQVDENHHVRCWLYDTNRFPMEKRHV